MQENETVSSQQPVDTPPKQPSGNSFSPVEEPVQEKKSNKWLMIGLGILLLVTLGIAGVFTYQNYQLKKQVTQLKPSLDNTKIPTPSTSFKEEEEKKDNLVAIEWLTYTDEKVSDLVFKYPKKGTLTVKRDKPEGNYTLEMIYEDLKLEINTIMGAGIGGRSYPPRSFYSIIYGNHYEGIGKNLSKDQPNNEMTISYFQFFNGGLEFGHFLTGKSTFLFSMPSNLQNKYEAIADIIACSTHNIEPDDKGLFAKAYHDTDANSVIGVNSDQSTYTILQGDSSIDEQIDGVVINRTAEYLVIDTRIGRGPEMYGRVYDLNQKEFLTFDGVQKRSKICCLAEWTSGYIFTSPDKDDDGEYKGKFEYDIQKRTRRLLEES